MGELDLSTVEMGRTDQALSPMMHMLDLATRLVAQAEADGTTIRAVELNGDQRMVAIHPSSEELAAALAVTCELTERSTFTDKSGNPCEWFQATVEGSLVYTFGAIR